MLHRWSLKQKMLLTYVLVVGITVLINSGFAVISIQKNNTERNQTAYTNAAELISTSAVNELNDYSNYAFLIAQNGSLVNLLTSPLSTYDQVTLLNTAIEPNIYFFTSNYPAIRSVTIYADLEKQPIPSKLFVDQQKVNAMQWFALTSDRYGAYWHYEDGRLFVSNRIQNFTTTSTIGMVHMEMDTSLLFAELNTSESGIRTIVVDRESNAVLFPEKLSEEERAFLRDPGAQHFIMLKQTDLPGTTLRLLSYTKEENISSHAVQELIPAFIITVATCAITGLLIHSFYKSFSQRMDTVIQTVERIDREHLSIRLPEVGTDELTALSVCLNTMSEKIQELIDEVSRTKDLEKRAELEALQAKINPHFLYNILDTINWYALDSDKSELSQLIGHLATYYRTNLNEGKTVTTIRQEIQNINAYINLHLLMYDYRFDAEYDLDKNLLESEICNFILQPLVENAIKHGINKLTDRRGKILISLHEVQENLVLCVQDNGIGMSPDMIKSILSLQGRAYGINNVQQRIHLYYGSAYGVEITSTLGSGTCVTITLPKKESLET